MLVESSQNLRFVLKEQLEMMNYEVVAFGDGESAIRNLKTEFYHICLLDINLPKKDGYSVSKELHRINPDLPVIILTSTDCKEEKIKCFEAGCHDYVIKPFSTDELLFRVEAILQKSECTEKKNIRHNYDTIQISDFTFNYHNLTLFNDVQSRVLTKKEAQLLRLLHEHQNKLVPREILTKEIWGKSKTVTSRSLDVYISKLRSYLISEKVEIINVHGLGYLLSICN